MERRQVWKRIKRRKTLYLFLVPAVVAVFIFNYLPMLGIVIAFQDYTVSKGFLSSPFVGFKHFAAMFDNPDFYDSLKNTLGINVFAILIGFPMPILMALMVNELKEGRFKKTVQSITYLPHFISWVIIGGIVYRLLDQDTGIVNVIMTSVFGGEAVAFMREPHYFWGIAIGSAIWKEIGWNSIIYLAAITAIDQQLYEAAIVDGAGRLKRIWHITLPGIAPTIIVLFILTTGSIVSVNFSVGGTMTPNFETLFNLRNAMVSSASDNLDILVYKIGVQYAHYSYASAIGLFQSVVALVLIIFSNRMSKKVNGYGLY
ncbi:ABC transporter permease [Cohnella hashimotonis]|uniref:ABC transporter permease subunit n=1 Tax=Cohnella hashimotonis TaxID=2826895 RepID=A0ABT6TNQ1_9BACL|nr:ABC transporter permease subunit [Cohnella hashimotonis]MDI4648461.1 ABC transporter permease subunit [Cohnella hashimotonis]